MGEIDTILACPDCGAVPKAHGPSVLKCSNGHQFPVLDGIPCFLPPELLPKDFASKGLKSFSRRGQGHSWAAGHWYDLKLGELLGNGAGQLLSIGAGPEEEANLLKAAGYQVIALDIDPMDGTKVLADAHRLPFASESFDVVVAFEVFEHLHSPWLAIQEVSRVLKPGGRFLGSVAFTKPYHHSYFHMTHRGVRSLLASAQLEIDAVAPGQNPFIHVVGAYLPLGPRKVSNRIYDFIYRGVCAIRRRAWALKTHRQISEKSDRFDPGFNFSFEEYDKIRLAPAIVFRANKRKTSDA